MDEPAEILEGAQGPLKQNPGASGIQRVLSGRWFPGSAILATQISGPVEMVIAGRGPGQGCLLLTPK